MIICEKNISLRRLGSPSATSLVAAPSTSRPNEACTGPRELICGPGTGSLQDQFNYSTAGPGGIGPLQLISSHRNRSLLVSTYPVRKCAVLNLDHEVSAHDRTCTKRRDAPLDDCLVLLRRTCITAVGCKFRKVAARQ